MPFSKSVLFSRLVSLLTCNISARWIRLVCLVSFFAIALSSLPVHLKHDSATAQGSRPRRTQGLANPNLLNLNETYTNAASGEPRKEYSRGGWSPVAAQSGGVVTVNPGAYQTPYDPGNLAVTSPSTLGHGNTITMSSAHANGGFGYAVDSDARSARWSAFQSVSGVIVSVRLKFNWSVNGSATAGAADDGGSASSSCDFNIDYSLDGGSSWINRVSRSRTAVGNDGQSIDEGGSEDILLSAGQNITQVQVRDSMITYADASGGESLRSNSLANMTTSISLIRVEVELDTTAPVISNVAAGGITTTGATISWTTNENSDSQVEYGTDQNYGQSTTLNPALVTAHSQGLSGLTAGTPYHYRVKSRDAAGNLAVSGDFSFTTATAGDTTPPVISGVAAGSITTTSATITWTTNENSDSQVEYGTSIAYGQSTTLDTTLGTAHSQSLSGLTNGTLYHYRVKSRDAAGNLAVSADFTFTTAQSIPLDGLASLGYNLNNNRITTPGFAYDEGGYQIRAVIDASGTQQQYRYDCAGRLAQVLDGSGTELARYSYGASSQRLMSVEGGVTRYYGWAGRMIIAEYEAFGPNALQWKMSYV